MALTRIYKYQIRKGAEEKYLKLQEEVLQLYRKHAEVDALFLHDLKNSAARTEVIRFFGPTPQADIQKIDTDPEVLNLFGLFQSEILDPEHPEIHEKTLLSETLPSEKAESRPGDAMSGFTRFAILLNTVSGASTTEKLIRAHVAFLRRLDHEREACDVRSLHRFQRRHGHCQSCEHWRRNQSCRERPVRYRRGSYIRSQNLGAFLRGK